MKHYIEGQALLIADKAGLDYNDVYDALMSYGVSVNDLPVILDMIKPGNDLSYLKGILWVFEYKNAMDN